MTAVLTLRPAESYYTSHVRGSDMTETVHFLDFVVDGMPLRKQLPVVEDLPTELRSSWPGKFVVEDVDALLGRRPTEYIDPDRVLLFRCVICGDPTCGAVSARLTVGADTVTWSDLRLEGRSAADSRIISTLMCTFDRVAYESTLQSAIEAVAALPGATGQRARHNWWSFGRR